MEPPPNPQHSWRQDFDILRGGSETELELFYLDLIKQPSLLAAVTCGSPTVIPSVLPVSLTKLCHPSTQFKLTGLEINEGSSWSDSSSIHFVLV
ncbi:hypothetical protein Y1Q_0007553 [Alligator mississippiensis]|uniref:Uncharacterized protein n=1 Tax=Alligator mississippiensis TaxID=8496 RepID=A0A151M554_ALLMI|nr:hypothetical protein Y1Q_0007553 [Alligator mississippiensis]